MAGRVSTPLLRSLAILLAAGALAACQQKASRPPCPAGKLCLEYGNTTDPATLDPPKATLIPEAAIIGELMQGLMEDGPDGAPVPGMATRWETSPDGLTWTFHLRPALWSDGVPVTADDFVFSYRRMLDPATASSYAYLLYLLKNGEAINGGKAAPASLGAEALDPHTLRLTLEHPAPYLPQLLKHQSYYPVPAHTVRRWGDAWTQPGHYVGNGPYTLVSWRLGDYLRIQKNPLFHDADKVCIDRIDFYPTQDTISAERRVQRGELDVNNLIQSSRVGFLRKGPLAPFIRVHPYLGTFYLTFNVRDVPAFRDIRVRRAIGMAIDRDFITHKLMRAGQVAGTAFVPVGIAGYGPPGPGRPHAAWADQPLAWRQAEARRLLAAAGHGPGRPLSVELKTPNSAPSVLLVQAVQADLAAVGVNARILQEDGQVAYQSFEARDFQLGSMAWIADYNDPLTFLALMRSDTGAQNYGGYANPVYDALLNQSDREPDAARRTALMARAEQIMLDDGYVAPIYTSVNLNLVSPRITGWTDNDVNVHRAIYLCMRR